MFMVIKRKIIRILGLFIMRLNVVSDDLYQKITQKLTWFFELVFY